MFNCSKCHKQINPKVIENFSINNTNSLAINNNKLFRPEISTRFRDFAQKNEDVYGSVSPCTGKNASPDFSNIGVL
jgi:hypothetical protein